MKKHSSSRLWFIGNALVILVVVGIPCLLLVLIKLYKLYNIEAGFDESKNLFFYLFLLITIVTFFWIKVSNNWKRWALKNVKTNEFEVLINKINNQKETIICKQNSELSKTKKIMRGVVFFTLMALCLYGDYYKGEKDRKFESEGIENLITVQRTKTSYSRKKLIFEVIYSYFVDSIQYTDAQIIDSGYNLFPDKKNGFEFQKGDQYKMIHLPKDPTIHRIDFQKPVGKTQVKILQVVKNQLLKNSIDTNQVNCLIESLYDNIGLSAVATLYNKDKKFYENEDYNNIKYGLLLKDEQYIIAVDRCLQLKQISK
jgi:hypothetical protein